MSVPYNFVDLVGKSFGKLTVISREPTPVYRGNKGSSLWIVKCLCGHVRKRPTSDVKRGKCGLCDIDKTAAERSGKSRRSQLPLDVRRNISHLKRTFGLTPEQFQQMIESQNRKCDLCNREFVYTPHIDHDHSCCPGKKSCGKCIRSLLCHNCNTALGNLQDSPELLRKAADYIEKWRLNMKAKTAETHELLPNQKQAPQTVGISGPGPFKGTRAGEKRAGSTKYSDYPGELTSNPAYKGGVGDCK